MKKNWNNPTIETLPVEETNNSIVPATTHDGVYGGIFEGGEGFECFAVCES